MSRLSVTLPLPPSSNRMWRKWRGRIVKSNEYRAWEKDAAAAVHAARNGLWPISPCVEIAAVRVNRRRDLDNLIKPLLDALQKGGAIKNDRDIVRIIAEWVPGQVAVANVSVTAA